MKKILLVVMTGLIAFHLQAQDYPMYSRGMALSYSDPAVNDLKFTAANNIAANMSNLSVGAPVKVSFVISNRQALNAVPAGTMEVKITLGSKFKMASAMNQIPALPLNEYFRWTVQMAPRNTQFIITGELIQDLPPSYAGTVSFNLVPTREGNSTITTQVMITNNNPGVRLSDIAQGNNYVSSSYSIRKAVGIKFQQFGAMAHNCELDMSWLIADPEGQAKNFIVETSPDGSNFVPVRSIVATGAASYNFTLSNLNAKNVTVRVKAETFDGSFVYSKPILVGNICGGKFMVSMFPNPLAKELKEVTLTAREGVFNGKYSIRLVDAAGKEIARTEVTYNNQTEVKFNTGVIASGTYFIHIAGGEEAQSVALPFVKQ